MSGPIVPPLEVTEVDGNPSGRPITKIIVSNGDLSISGRTATIDTTGSGGSPATPKDTIQFNSDPAGTFTSDTFFKMSVIGGDGTTAIQAGNMILGGNKIAANTANQSVSVICDGTGEIFLQSESDGGGTFTDSVVNIMCNTNTDESQLKFRDGTNVNNGTITLDGSGHMILNNNVAAKNISLKVGGSGTVIAENITTDTDSQLSILADGTGTPILKLENGTMATEIICEANKKLTINGGVGQTFIFDTSSATGGITWPDGTTQITASSGASFPLEAPGGSAAAPSYSFTGDTNTGMFSEGADEINFTLGGTRKISFEAAGLTMNSGQIIADNAGTPSAPSISFSADLNTGIYRYYADTLSFSTGGNARLTVGSGGDLLIGGTWGYDGAAGTSGQVFSSGGAGSPPTWEDAGGGEFNLVLPYGGDIGATWYNMTATQPGWGGQNSGTSSPLTNVLYFPFISGNTGDLASITVNVTTAVAASTIDIGIYSDADGLPASLIGKANIDTSATGHITQTSLSATIAMVRSTQYWVAFAKVDGTGMIVRGVDQAYPAYGPASISIGTSLNYTEHNCVYIDGESALPASITTASLLSTNYDVPNVGLLW